MIAALRARKAQSVAEGDSCRTRSRPDRPELEQGWYELQGALLTDPEKLLVQLGQVQEARVMKFTSAPEITTKAATIKAYVREAVAAEKAGMKIETKPPEFPVPEELKEKFRNDPRFKRAFEALTPGRQRGYLFHFAGAKQSGTRTARIEKAMPAIFEGRGFLERR